MNTPAIKVLNKKDRILITFILEVQKKLSRLLGSQPLSDSNWIHLLQKQLCEKDHLKRVKMMVTWIIYTLLLLTCFTSQSGHSIKKRSVVQFASMIETVTGKRAIDFNEYGDYCGLGGSGHTVDKIDRCCKEHDTCYGRANYVCLDLFNLRAYFSNYKWEYNGSDIICENHNVCDQVLCLCDKEAVLCFNKNITDYNPNLQHLSFWGKLLKMFVDHIHGIG